MRLGLVLLLIAAFACSVKHTVSAPQPGATTGVPARPASETTDGCVSCHGLLDAPTMHDSPGVEIGCTDCHGGDGAATEKERAHPQPRHPEFWPSSANPERLDASLNKESPQYIRFVNPGDLRVAGVTCGGCHAQEVKKVRKSMMAHGSMLWGAALYNNGVVPFKNPRFGEAYGPDGTSLRLKSAREFFDRG